VSVAALIAPPERQPLLALDPSLAELVPVSRVPALERALYVDVRVLRRGELDLRALQARSRANIGLLLLDGVVSREVLLEEAVSAELLGSGDLIRPWEMVDGADVLSSHVRWGAVSDLIRVAVLDRRLASELRACPEVAVALIDRADARAARVATMHAIAQMTRVDRRLIALFKHFAGRWGRVTNRGLVIPLRLSHRMLGQLIGARRPTVSSALAELARDRELVRSSDGSWLLAAASDAAAVPVAPRIEPRRPVLVTQYAEVGSPAARVGQA
jgi:CRP/FNR family transcriptional regulator, cyclic AMP receptor protein